MGHGRRPHRRVPTPRARARSCNIRAAHARADLCSSVPASSVPTSALTTKSCAVERDDDVVDCARSAARRSDPFEVVATYVVGCDGAVPIVGREGGCSRATSGARATRSPSGSRPTSSGTPRHRSGALFFVCNPGSDDIVSIWTCVEPWTEWSTIFVRHGLRPNDLDEESVLARVRAAIGDPDVDVRIKHISAWEMKNVVAASYRRGRMFIAGDAAHRHPPANGLGLQHVDAGRVQPRVEAGTGPAGSRRGGVARQLRRRAPAGRTAGRRPREPERRRDGVVARPDRVAARPERSRRRTRSSTRSSGPTARNAAPGAAQGPRRDERPVQRARRRTGPAVHVERGRRRRHAVPARTTATPTSTTTRRPIPGARCRTRGSAGATQDVSTLDLAAYDRFTLLTGAGGGPSGRRPRPWCRRNSASRCGRSRSRSASPTTTCSARGRDCGRSATGGACSCDPTGSSRGGAMTRSTTPSGRYAG